MTTVTLILADPVALTSATARIVTAVVPLAALAATWGLVCMRVLPSRLRRRRKEEADDD